MLRDYQARAISALRAGFARGLKRQLLVAPTGSGKSVMAAHMIAEARKLGHRAVVCAHRRELIVQLKEKMVAAGVEDIGVIMSDHPERRRSATTQVCSIQTLIRREFPPAQIVILDEAHHSAAKSYQRLFDHYPDAWFVGLTASPFRLDGRGLGNIFEDVVVAATPLELIEQGHLVDFVGFKYRSPDMHGVATVGGDYEKNGLTVACTESTIIGNVVDEWFAHARDMRTILFGASIQHCELLAWHFRNRGVAAETIDYRMSTAERDAIVARVRSGETRIICNVGILGEGFDSPELQCALLCRPTRSLSLFLQMCGRVLRPSPGKAVARFHDHGFCFDRHGTPSDERDYSLTTSRKHNEAKLTPLSTCPSCFAIFASASVCPLCGHTRPAVVREAGKNIDGVAVDIRAPKSEMDAFKEELVRTAIAKKYKPGYVLFRFKERYPDAPTPFGAYRRVKAAQG